MMNIIVDKVPTAQWYRAWFEEFPDKIEEDSTIMWAVYRLLLSQGPEAGITIIKPQ